MSQNNNQVSGGSDDRMGSEKTNFLKVGLKKLTWMVVSYLKGIDATIRWLGAMLIMGIFYGVIWGGISLLNTIPVIDLHVDRCAGLSFLIGLPVIIRLSLLGGGFAIPPLLKSRKKYVEL